MSDDPLIRCTNVSKRFSRLIRTSVRHALSEIFEPILGRTGPRSLRQDEFWALRGINFQIARGESVALIGDNGAGKSTLIKLIMGRMLPTTGSMETHGTISALTVLGLGFDPILSGRENIVINATTLGMSRAEALAATDSIIAFAELEEFIDAPVQTYSSGMKSRLGYAVAAHVRPDILLLDEVLAVGDIWFRRKCRRHIKDYIANGGTTLLVTHDLQGVQTMCNRCLVLERGRLVFDGPPTEGIHFYTHRRHGESPDDDLSETPEPVESTEPPAGTVVVNTTDEPVEVESSNSSETEQVVPEVALPTAETNELPVDSPGESPPPVDPIPRPRLDPNRRMPVVIDDLSVRHANGGEPQSGEPAYFTLHYRAIESIPRIAWGFSICTEDGLIHIGSLIEGFSDAEYHVEPGAHQFRIRVDALPLHAGRYTLKGGIGELDSGAALFNVGWEDKPIVFSVRSTSSIRNNMHLAMGDLVIIEGHAVPVGEPPAKLTSSK